MNAKSINERKRIFGEFRTFSLLFHMLFLLSLSFADAMNNENDMRRLKKESWVTVVLVRYLIMPSVGRIFALGSPVGTPCVPIVR